MKQESQSQFIIQHYQFQYILFIQSNLFKDQFQQHLFKDQFQYHLFKESIVKQQKQRASIIQLLQVSHSLSNQQIKQFILYLLKIIEKELNSSKRLMKSISKITISTEIFDKPVKCESPMNIWKVLKSLPNSKRLKYNYKNTINKMVNKSKIIPEISTTEYHQPISLQFTHLQSTQKHSLNHSNHQIQKHKYFISKAKDQSWGTCQNSKLNKHKIHKKHSLPHRYPSSHKTLQNSIESCNYESFLFNKAHNTNLTPTCSQQFQLRSSKNLKKSQTIQFDNLKNNNSRRLVEGISLNECIEKELDPYTKQKYLYAKKQKEDEWIKNKWGRTNHGTNITQSYKVMTLELSDPCERNVKKHKVNAQTPQDYYFIDVEEHNLKQILHQDQQKIEKGIYKHRRFLSTEKSERKKMLFDEVRQMKSRQEKRLDLPPDPWETKHKPDQNDPFVDSSK